jgi:hypothetical protein
MLGREFTKKVEDYESEQAYLRSLMEEGSTGETRAGYTPVLEAKDMAPPEETVWDITAGPPPAGLLGDAVRTRTASPEELAALTSRQQSLTSTPVNSVDDALSAKVEPATSLSNQERVQAITGSTLGDFLEETPSYGAKSGRSEAAAANKQLAGGLPKFIEEAVFEWQAANDQVRALSKVKGPAYQTAVKRMKDAEAKVTAAQDWLANKQQGTMPQKPQGVQETVVDTPQGPRRVAVVGSREGVNPQEVVEYINSLPEGTIVVSGGARGVDSWAAEAARARGLEVVEIPADWATYGKSAGFRRNADIVNSADEVTAFWNGISRGTQDTISKAQRAGKKVDVRQR